MHIPISITVTECRVNLPDFMLAVEILEPLSWEKWGGESVCASDRGRVMNSDTISLIS